MVSHVKMDGILRYRRLRQYANGRRIPRIRHLRDRFSPLEEYGSEDFRMRFRLRKESVIRLANILQTDLEHETMRGHPLAPMQQILITLRFYATGSFQRVVGDLFGISIFAVSTVIHKVSRAIAKRKGQFISFQPDLSETKRKFYEIAHFSGVVGAIDCTHVRIVCPDRDSTMAFINRKQFYSINVQAVCDSEAVITNIVARIFENSTVAERLRDGDIDGMLVGDSGYACKSYLMTPILRPTNEGEVRYNIAHRRTRCIIERCFGILKRRFPCVHSGMRTFLRNTLVIIVAVAVLHNFALSQREPNFDDDMADDDDVPCDVINAANASGTAKRQLIISQYF